MRGGILNRIGWWTILFNVTFGHCFNTRGTDVEGICLSACGCLGAPYIPTCLDGATQSTHCGGPDDSLARHFIVRASPASAGYCFLGSGSQTGEATYVCVDGEQYRIGEALNPGPTWLGHGDVFALGTANPTGIRGKEQEILDLPHGIWTVTETHLSQPQMSQTLSRLKYLAGRAERQLRVLPGAAVALRARSDFAGVWSGVMHLSDAPARKVTTQWPNGEYQAGRVSVAQHWIGGLGITGAAVYGWTPGPTWPGAKKLTNQLFARLTETLIHNRTGCRYVSGDFNINLEDIRQIEYWKSMGWQEVQELNRDLHSVPIQSTCKGATRKDFVMVSPELAALFQSADVLPVFCDHSAVCGYFKVPMVRPTAWIWPMPGRIDWTRVDLEGWRKQCEEVEEGGLVGKTSTDQFRNWAKSFEKSLDGHIDSVDGNMPSQWKGRGRHLHPVQQEMQAPLVKASRHGDVRLTSEFVSRGVQLWFKQLRRIQALHQNLQRNSDSPAACSYRIELWSSILRGSGFREGFPTWWKRRRIQLQGTPTELRGLSINPANIARIFEDFNANFKQFESWHIRRQQEISALKMKEFAHLAFKKIRTKRKEYVDTVTETQESEILAVSNDGIQIHLEHDLGQGISDFTTWWIDEFNEVELRRVGEAVFEVTEGDCLLSPGQLVTCKMHSVETNTIQKALGQFWDARWLNHQDIPTEAWHRILNFGRAFLPSRPLQYEPLSTTAWDIANSRYTDMSARGPDGVHPRDLQNMAGPYKDQLLMILRGVEQGDSTWPSQLLTGFTACLAKTTEAETVAQFRPLVIYSAVYRSWSTARARPLLAHIASLAEDTQFGFLPERESLEISFLVQAMVELTTMSDGDLCGLVTDIQKAFENVPRYPVLMLAAHIGAPKEILQAWGSFLHNMERRFHVRGEIGPAHVSTAGVPEGCAMSCFAMAIIDLCFHSYFKIFAPEVLPVSFVDNLALMVAQAAQLLKGTVILKEFLSLWHLDLDSKKSWTWSTKQKDRTLLEALQFEVRTHACDLGAQHSYTGTRHIEMQSKRMDSLEQMWPMLRRLDVDQDTKGHVLVAAFWPRAFHGIGVCLMGQGHVDKLRTKAVKALGHGRAGASPLVRMLIGKSLRSDPGFYQLTRVLMDFRRIAHKQEEVVNMWHQHWHLFRGKGRVGPFMKLLEVFEQICWHVVEPPWIRTHTGITFDLMQTPAEAIVGWLEEAWTTMVSRRLQKRKDFDGVKNIDYKILHRAQHGLTAIQRAQIAALQEGAFLTGKQQSKFDNFQSGYCRWCSTEDTIDHRVTACSALADARAGHEDILGRWNDLTVSQRHRLLPEKFALWDDWIRELGPLEPPEPIFEPCELDLTEWTDIFTDASCLAPEMPEASIVAWACVSATHSTCIASGPLSGPIQNIDRGELQALTVALNWTVHTGSSTTYWVDSAYTATGLWRLLECASCLPYDTNVDLWQKCQQMVQQCRGRIRCQHVPSHRQDADCLNPVDTWACYWNRAADKAAGAAHSAHSPVKWTLWQQLVSHQRMELAKMKELQAVHTAIAVKRGDLLKSSCSDEAVVDLECEEPEQLLTVRDVAESWLDVLPPDWLGKSQGVQSFLGFGPFGAQFVQKLVLADSARRAILVSWLELAIWAWHVFQGRIPVAGLKKGVWVDPSTGGSTMCGSQTFAMVLRCVKDLVRSLFIGLDLPVHERSGLDLAACGVAPPQKGLALRWTQGDLSLVRRRLSDFCGRRPIRTVNDLTRPLKRTWE